MSEEQEGAESLSGERYKANKYISVFDGQGENVGALLIGDEIIVYRKEITLKIEGEDTVYVEIQDYRGKCYIEKSNFDHSDRLVKLTNTD